MLLSKLFGEGTLRATPNAPVTVVANGELTVVHQKMHMFSRKACDTDSHRKICTDIAQPSLSSLIDTLDAGHLTDNNAPESWAHVFVGTQPRLAAHWW